MSDVLKLDVILGKFLEYAYTLINFYLSKFCSNESLQIHL